MAGDADKVQAGAEFIPPRAETWNALVDLLNDKRRNRFTTSRPIQPAERPLQPGQIKIKNDTGAQLRLGEVVELQDKLLTDVDRHYPWFTADTPDETKPFAICLEPIPNTKIGLAQISGRCPALINVGATTDLWAYVSSGADVLVGDRFWGDVRLLYAPAGTGEQLVWVNIEKSPQSWVGKADAAIAVDASNTVSVWAGSPPADTTHNIASCLNWTGVAIDSGGRVRVERIDRKPRAFPLECPA